MGTQVTVSATCDSDKLANSKLNELPQGTYDVTEDGQKVDLSGLQVPECALETGGNLRVRTGPDADPVRGEEVTRGHSSAAAEGERASRVHTGGENLDTLLDPNNWERSCVGDKCFQPPTMKGKLKDIYDGAIGEAYAELNGAVEYGELKDFVDNNETLAKLKNGQSITPAERQVLNSKLSGFVTAYQQFENEQTGANLKVDGKYGPKTRAAVLKRMAEAGNVVDEPTSTQPQSRLLPPEEPTSTSEGTTTGASGGVTDPNLTNDNLNVEDQGADETLINLEQDQEPPQATDKEKYTRLMAVSDGLSKSHNDLAEYLRDEKMNTASDGSQFVENDEVGNLSIPEGKDGTHHDQAAQVYVDNGTPEQIDGMHSAALNIQSELNKKREGGRSFTEQALNESADNPALQDQIRSRTDRIGELVSILGKAKEKANVKVNQAALNQQTQDMFNLDKNSPLNSPADEQAKQTVNSETKKTQNKVAKKQRPKALAQGILTETKDVQDIMSNLADSLKKENSSLLSSDENLKSSPGKLFSLSKEGAKEQIVKHMNSNPEQFKMEEIDAAISRAQAALTATSLNATRTDRVTVPNSIHDKNLKSDVASSINQYDQLRALRRAAKDLHKREIPINHEAALENAKTLITYDGRSWSDEPLHELVDAVFDKNSQSWNDVVTNVTAASHEFSGMKSFGDGPDWTEDSFDGSIKKLEKGINDLKDADSNLTIDTNNSETLASRVESSLLAKQRMYELTAAKEILAEIKGTTKIEDRAKEVKSPNAKSAWESARAYAGLTTGLPGYYDAFHGTSDRGLTPYQFYSQLLNNKAVLSPMEEASPDNAINGLKGMLSDQLQSTQLGQMLASGIQLRMDSIEKDKQRRAALKESAKSDDK